MIGGAKVYYDGIVAFLKMDPKKITIPMLTIHSEDHQIVLYGASGLLTGKLLRNEAHDPKKTFCTVCPTTKRKRSIQNT